MGGSWNQFTSHEFTPSLLLGNLSFPSLCVGMECRFDSTVPGVSRGDGGSEGVMRERGSFWGQDIFGVLRRIGSEE